MKTIKLNPEQIVNLIKNQRVLLSTNKVVELLDDEIVYNNKGKISKLKELNLKFSEPKEDNPFLRNLLCDYFNCEPFEIICTDISIKDRQAVFRVRFTPEKEMGLIVVTGKQAELNTISMTDDDEDIQKLISENQIGLYHRLGTSEYFFRWEDYYYT